MLDAETAPVSETHWARPVYDQHMADLEELRELAMQMAREAARSGDDMAFAKASRSVRLTIQLEDRVIAAIDNLGKAKGSAKLDDDDLIYPTIEHVFIDCDEA